MRSQVNMVTEMTSSDIVILVIVTVRLGKQRGSTFRCCCHCASRCHLANTQTSPTEQWRIRIN